MGTRLFLCIFYSFLVDFGIERFDLVHMEGYLVDQGDSLY